MSLFWQRLAAAMTPGVRVLLILQTACWLLSVAGQATHTLNLPRWLAATPAVWHGQVWRLVTYALVPSSLMDYVMSAFALLMLGPLLERHWTKGELWWYCGVVAAGTGIVTVLLAQTLLGAASVMLGLLVAWAFVSGHETMSFPILGEMTVRQMVLIPLAVSMLMTFLSAGLAATLVVAAGWLTGWLYLWLRHKWLMNRASRAFHSERINRLEL